MVSVRTLSPRRPLLLAVVVLLATRAEGQSPTTHGLPFKGEEAEVFLKTARVTEKKPIGVGVTHAERLTLTDGERSCRAAWKTIDERRRGVTSFPGSGFVVDFTDSYKHEIAAYELDKLLGLDFVPPTVERTLDGKPGALQLWVEGVMTEWERSKQKVEPPDLEAWNDTMYKVRLIHQLTYNSDYRNIRNVLIDPEFRIYLIDFSRAFYPQPFLLEQKELKRFSRSLLDSLKRLDRAQLDEKLGRSLGRPQIDGLLKRRDLIVSLAARRVAEQGESAVFYP